jgi:FixJ family two-component response regulator
MSKTSPRIFIVDDDIPFSRSLAILVESVGYEVEAYTSAEEFLETRPYEGPSCLLLDVRMPGLTGPVLQRELARRNITIPVVFLTAHGDVPTGVKAMKDEKLFEAIDTALDKDIQLKMEQKEIGRIHRLLASLTPREHEALRWIITGMLNKQIASSLEITERTVKFHRSQIMQKLNVVSVAELVRLTQKANISPARESPKL